MKVHFAYFSPWILAILITINIGPPDNRPLDNFYERGKTELQKGAWKQALNIWLKAKSEVGAVNEPDPRIGFAFMDVVTRQEAEQYFSLAHKMYFWGIKNADVAKYHQELQLELDRLEPLMSKEEARKFQELLKSKSPDFTKQLVEFWITRDPFPSSSYNERLLEHWKRIQYARKNFAIRRNTSYNTDDRGEIYVRFGSPTEIKQRSISINKIVDPVSGTNIPLYNNVALKAEIWYYHNLIDGERNTSFVFGRSGQGGAFGLQPGVLSLVPVSGNRISNYYDDQKVLTKAISQSSFGGSASGTRFDASGGGTFVMPGYTQVSREGAELMLKYAVLEEIGAIDAFHNRLYQDMTSDIIKASMSNRDEKFTHTARSNLPTYNNKEISSAMLRDRSVPENVSDTKTQLENFAVDRQILRFMDEDFNTIYMLATEAVNLQPLQAYASTQPAMRKSDIVQLNTLYQYDEDWNLTMEQPHLIPLNAEGYFGKGIYYFDEQAHRQSILFSSQYLDRQPNDQDDRIHDKLNAYIIASSQADPLPFPAPMELEGDKQMQLSDILLADIQQEDQTQRIPFVPNLDRQFKPDESMLVYFEAYNIPAGQNYQIEYKIEGEDKKGRAQKIGRSIILNYTAAGVVSPQWFEVPIADLPTYKTYRLSLRLKLPDLEHAIERRVSFQLE